MEEQRGNRRIKKKIPKTRTKLRLRSVTAKGNFLPQTVKLGSNPIAHRASSSVDEEVKRIQKRRGNIYFQISPHIPSYGSLLLHGQGHLWKTTWRSYERFGREFVSMVNVHEYHS